MQLVDIGANLTHQSFVHDFDEVVSAAQDAGIAHIILTGTDLQSSEQASQLAQSQTVYFSATAGFHPHVASTCGDEEFRRIAELARLPQVVAVGETGLDFNRNYSPAAEQIDIFERHLQLAAELHKPVFLHQRDAHDAFHSLLKQYRPELTGGVVHCFTDSEAALQEYLELDLYIGITGWICDERRGQQLQSLVADIPPERLLLETDAPYLLPRTLSPKPRTRRNEPRYLLEVLNKVAECCGRTPAAVAEATTANARRLFGLSMA